MVRFSRRTGLQLMLGVLRAAIPGAAFAQTWPNLVSLWTFDETSGPTFADSGRAGVAMDIVGTWADLSTGSLVEGIGGTSAYTNGSGHATIPANDPHHDLPELTVSFYYQRNSAAAKHTLVAAGDGTQPGDFSIEVLANGKLRGYHVGLNPSQNPQLRFFESRNGITGTNLQVGTAHRIDLTLGSLGARIYLDGAPLTSAFIPANTNSWNNIRVKYVGIFPGGVLSPADGAFDGLRIWDQQLNAAQIATLEPAQSITLSGNLPLSEPFVPNLAQWLINDDMAIPTTSTVRYVSPTGSGVGGTTEGAAGALQPTLSASAVGDTVVCLPGYYSAPNGLTFPSGSSPTNPVTVMAKPGEWAVLCQDVSFLNLGQLDHAPGEGSAKTWTLHDAATNTWRTPYGGVATTLEGVYFQGGMAHMLFSYPSLTALMSARDSGGSKPQTKNQYWFSGTAVSGGFAYIRLDRPNWCDMVNQSGGTVDATYGAWPDDGRYTIGIEGGGTQNWFSRSNGADFKTGRPIIGQGLNPNNLRIYLAATNNVRLLNQASGNFTRLGSGMNSLGYRYYTTGKGNHEIHRGCHYIRGYFGLTADANISNITAHRARFFGTGEHRLQGSMAVMKFGEFMSPANQMLEGSHRNGFLNPTFTTSFTMTNLTFDNCTICYYHEVLVGDRAITKIRFVNCAFHMIYDEWGQVANESLAQLEVGYCYLLDSAAFNGASFAGSTAHSPFSSEWHHHNIIDQRCPRSAFATRTPCGGPWSIGRDVSSRGASKKYNNTIIFNPDDPPGRGLTMGWAGNVEAVSGAPNIQSYDEIFNNIVIRADTKRYFGNEGGSPKRNDAVEILMQVRREGGQFNQCYRDYNLYHRACPVDPAIGAFRHKKYHGVSFRFFPGNDYDYVRAIPAGQPAGSVFYGSSEWAHSRDGINQPGGNGWEHNSSDADPQIPSVSNFPSQRRDYRPQNLAAVGAVAVPPSGANWWGSPGWTSYGATPVPFNMAPSPWKGALDPNGTAIPVGVQNP